MIPIELRLQNFLSYGTAAPALDFEQFQVACLSGRNGQGKSALLDAITWALWGEARKSGGSGKPDSDLIRIGTTHMEVELVFDLEDERYRVTRTYARSASGKTSKPGLEVQIYEPATGDYRPLTGASLRETQAHLDRILGIDYDTFINSAFLLQGRSDEFTKKNPSERKTILARILNLSRYDRLAELARDRERAAIQTLQLAESEVERLKEALSSEAEWKEQRTDVQVHLKAAQEQREAVRREETRITEALAALDAQAQEADSLRRSLTSLTQRHAQLDQDARRLTDKIERAEGLLAREQQIRQDYERYQALLKERDDLDEKRDLYRGVEKQVEQRQAELKDRRNEQEKRLHGLEADLRAQQTVLSDCVAQLAERPALVRRLEQARAAQAEFETLRAVQERRQRLEQEIQGYRQQLHGMQQTLRGQLAALEQQIESTTRRLPDRDALRARRTSLVARAGRLSDFEADLEATRVRGQNLAEQMRERSGSLQPLEAEREKKADELERIRAVTEGTCPTCGTDLTPEHRAEVERTYQRALHDLDERMNAIREWMEARKTERDHLREVYRRLDADCKPLRGVAEELATLDEQLRAADEEHEALQQRRAEAEALRRKLEAEAFGEAERERLRARCADLDQIDFDQDRYDRLSGEAAQAGQYEGRLKELEQTAGRKEQLERAIERMRREAETLRADLAGGTATKALHEQIRQLQAQLAAIGFDPARFDAVRQSLRALDGAGDRMKDLLDAQQHKAEYEAERTSLRERQTQAEAEQQRVREKLDALSDALARRDALDAERQTQATARAAADAEVQRYQRQLGELDAWLEQADRDRAALTAQRARHTEATAERALYKHLRTAFGKHGIPSLIIEETLPEIEERANALLHRLSDGRMSIRLETLKDKKTGGTKETLDIIITDEQGVPRAYETFSGGEAFRVNFALRIALAQLLAERSGVRVRTLVVDEGFGTQDAQGVQNMVEAIQTIRDDFDKIIVITHLDELKEAFPVRIEVEKDPVAGSSFMVMGV